MSKKPFRILSIDFDFFQNVTKSQLACYPDGVDLSTPLSEIVWAGRYSTDYQTLLQVSLNLRLFNQLLHIIKNQRPLSTKVMIANSHKHIYDFILENCNTDRHLRCINVDLHHDVNNSNPDLDCGNWISHLAKEFTDYKFSWIAREISMDAYDISPADKIPVKFDFTDILTAEFDAIFICRSDAWLVPHLDKHFQTLVDTCCDTFKSVLIEDCVRHARNIDSISEIAKTERNIRLEMIRHMGRKPEDIIYEWKDGCLQPMSA